MPGMDADMVVFGENRIRDVNTFENPRDYPEGIDYVLVNGEIAVDHGVPYGRASRQDHTRLTMPPTARPFPIAGDGRAVFSFFKEETSMSYSPTLGSVFNRTKMRDPSHVCSFSGMCAMCTADCIGSCEIGLSARPGHGDRISHHHGGKPDRLGKGLSRRLFPFQHQRQILRGNGGSAGRRSRHHLPCGARTGDRHPQPRKAGAADHPARAHQAQLARLLRRRGHGGRQRGHRRRGREQGPDARLRKRQGRPRPEAPGNAGRLQQV